jgi:hypothetical protein
MSAENVFSSSRRPALLVALLLAACSSGSSSPRPAPAPMTPPPTQPPAGGPGPGGPGGAGGAGGTGGTGGTGGSAPTDGAPPSADAPSVVSPDAAPAASDGAPPADTAGEGPADGCNAPAIDGYAVWLATGEGGATIPARDSILVDDGGKAVGKVMFVGGGWHGVSVHLSNNTDKGLVDLSKSSGFTLTYSATADLFIQLRSSSHWDGGSHYVIKVPATGGMVTTRTFPFIRASWQTIDVLGIPTQPFDAERAEVRGLVFVGLGANTLVFQGLKVDGYTPPCPPPPKHGG